MPFVKIIMCLCLLLLYRPVFAVPPVVDAELLGWLEDLGPLETDLDWDALMEELAKEVDTVTSTRTLHTTSTPIPTRPQIPRSSSDLSLKRNDPSNELELQNANKKVRFNLPNTTNISYLHNYVVSFVSALDKDPVYTLQLPAVEGYKTFLLYLGLKSLKKAYASYTHIFEKPSTLEKYDQCVQITFQRPQLDLNLFNRKIPTIPGFPDFFPNMHIIQGHLSHQAIFSIPMGTVADMGQITTDRGEGIVIAMGYSIYGPQLLMSKYSTGETNDNTLTTAIVSSSPSLQGNTTDVEFRIFTWYDNLARATSVDILFIKNDKVYKEDSFTLKGKLHTVKIKPPISLVDYIQLTNSTMFASSELNDFVQAKLMLYEGKPYHPYLTTALLEREHGFGIYDENIRRRYRVKQVLDRIPSLWMDAWSLNSCVELAKT